MAFKYKKGDLLTFAFATSNVADDIENTSNMFILILDINVGGWYTIMNMGNCILGYKEKGVHYDMTPFKYHSFKLVNLKGWMKLDKDILPLSVKLSMIMHSRNYEALNGQQI